jgi:hypothetical protein
MTFFNVVYIQEYQEMELLKTVYWRFNDGCIPRRTYNG